MARAEKRAAWTRTAEANRKANRLAKELQCKEEEEESSEDESMGEDSDGQENSPCQPRQLGFEVKPRRDERGRWQAESPELHAIRLAQLARGVAPSTVAMNISDVLELVAPGNKVPAPCDSQRRRQCTEVTVCSQTMAAYKFAIAERILSFGWDESTKFGDGVFSCNAQVEYTDGKREDICLRGLSILPAGGKSAAVLAHIDERIFTHSRRLLQAWLDDFEKHNGAGSWAAAGHPLPERVGLHRLAEDTVLVTDTCNGARCTRRMLGELVMERIKETIGVAAWEAMGDEERDRKYKTYRGDCWQHYATSSLMGWRPRVTRCCGPRCTTTSRCSLPSSASIRAAAA